MLHPRARTMLLLAVPALIIGVASSLVLIVVMKAAAVLQTILWTALPVKLGISIDSPGWIMMMLTLTGIAVGLVIRYSPGHAGPDPALEPLIGAPVSPSALPGLIIALIIGLAGGVSLGPEHPIMAVNIALAVFLGARLFPRVGALDWTILASAGTIGALFGTPVAAALIFSQTLSSDHEVPLWDKLFAPLMAAAAGALTTSLFSIPIFHSPSPTTARCNSPIFQRCRRRRDRHCAGDGRGVVSPSPASPDAQAEASGADSGHGGFYSGRFRRHRRDGYAV